MNIFNNLSFIADKFNGSGGSGRGGGLCLNILSVSYCR